MWVCWYLVWIRLVGMRRYCAFIYSLAIVVLSTVSSFSIVPSSIITRTSQHTHNSIDVHKLHDQNNIRFTSYPTATKKYTNLQVTPSIISTAMPILSPSPVTTDILRTVTGLILAKRISASGYRKRSLNKSGALTMHSSLHHYRYQRHGVMV